MKLLNIVILLALTLFVSINGTAKSLDDFKELQGTLLIAGGTAHLPIMYEIKHKVEKSNPNILIIVRGGGSSAGIEQVGNELVDIGNAGRPLKSKEKELYDLWTIPIAIDAICIVVHPSNPISNLSIEEVRRIYTGELTNWKQVGGSDNPIVVYSRSNRSGTHAVFSNKMMNKQPIINSATIIADHDKMKVVISWDKNGIGYMSLGHIDSSKIKPLTLNGIEPNLSTAKSGEYHLARKLYTNLPKDKIKINELAKCFIDYLLSPEGSEIISNNGLMPMK